MQAKALCLHSFITLSATPLNLSFLLLDEQVLEKGEDLQAGEK